MRSKIEKNSKYAESMSSGVSVRLAMKMCFGSLTLIEEKI